MRYFLELGYNGAPFHGWQRQPADISVQSVIEDALGTILRCPTPITGAGRTDAGVNARKMYAHFDAEIEAAEIPRILRGLNRLCGKDIAIYDIIAVAEDAHARFDATSRTYRYFIRYRKSPFDYKFSWLCPMRLDLDAMNEAASLLLRESDFTSFAKLHSDAKTNICNVTHAMWTPVEEGAVFCITADRFLRGMVRAVVGTLVDVGRGKLSREGVAAILAGKDRCLAGTSMPPEALFLWDVTYPYL